MRILRDFSALPAEDKGAVVALGNFDGVHLGHQTILQHCRQEAKRLGAPAAVMTFEPHPREFFAKTPEKIRLYPLKKKLRILSELGIDILYLVRFNAKLASRSAEYFVEELLHKQLGVKHIVTGYDFAFGQGRRGNTEFLAATAKRLGFGFTACPPVTDSQKQLISSSAIRRALAEGDVKRAAELLGRPYRIEGPVRHGDHRGRALGFPTANLSLADLFKPRFGVYAVRLKTNTGWGEGVANIGVRPSFDMSEPLLEVHAFDRDENLYGQRLSVELIEFIRGEQRFDSLDALRAQIAADCARARKVLDGYR